jgi:hypothetical protein
VNYLIPFSLKKGFILYLLRKRIFGYSFSFLGFTKNCLQSRRFGQNERMRREEMGIVLSLKDGRGMLSLQSVWGPA